MIRHRILSVVIMLVFAVNFTACGAGGNNNNNNNNNQSQYSILVTDHHVEVSAFAEFNVVTDSPNPLSYEIVGANNGIAIVGNRVLGLVAGTSTKIKVASGNVVKEFNVIVDEDTKAQITPEDVDMDAIAELDGRTDFIMGVDMSSVFEVEKNGGKYYLNGTRQDPFKIMADGGANWVRLRIWNDPYGEDGLPYGGGTNDLPTTINMALRAKLVGLKVLLDFHYSDFWADPGKQIVPKAWQGITTPQEMKTAISQFTTSTLTAMDEADCLPDMVQIGNEITPGMLMHSAEMYQDVEGEKIYFNNAGGWIGVNMEDYLASASEAVRAVDPSIEVMVHIDKGGNAGASDSFYGRLHDYGLDYDIIGLSYYPFWHGTVSAMTNNINALAAKYDKKIVIAETSYAFTNERVSHADHIFTDTASGVTVRYEISPQGQVDALSDVAEALAKVNNNLGYGLFYWEPAWLPVRGAGWRTGSTTGWANQALFAFDGSARTAYSIFNALMG